MKKEILFVVVISLLVSGNRFRAYGLTKPVEVEKKMETAVKIEGEAQKKADAWVLEKENILAEIRALKHREQWLDFQKAKYSNYIGEEKKILKDLKRKKEEYDKIQMNLEPYLDQTLKRLKIFVKSDLQFLRDERAKRLLFLEDSLNDYRVSLSEKLRRVLEALQVEANYGRSIEKRDSVININGKVTEVQLFRVGRLALFYESVDGRQIGYLDRKSGRWKRLPDKYKKGISRAMEMSERMRSIDLVDLPIGSWKCDEK